jgi:GWxTD domain-containing protein
MKRNNLQYVILPVIYITIACISFSCKISKNTFDPKDLSYLYNPLKNSMNPRYGVYNESEKVSVLSVKFFNNDLYFNEANPKGILMAQMAVSVRLYNISQGKKLADTISYELEVLKEQARDEYLFHIPLKVEKGLDYVAEVRVADKIRQLMVHAFVPFNTTSENNRYNFYARGHFLHNELLNPVIRKNEYLNIICNKKPVDSIFISFYSLFEGIPYPPSMVLPEKSISADPDTIVGLSYSDTLPMMFPRKGLYLCRTGKNISEGYSVMNFGPSFPAMTSPAEMIEPLAYLASGDEMTAMRTSIKPKLALDDFWIKCGGNIDKSRELIRIYYTRALYANYYFSSYREGWRTDRGMIYLIYGPPDKVYRSNEEESWGYRKAEIKSSWGTRYQVKEDYLFFVFKKRDSKFSDNDYSLNRSETVVSFWDNAVASWRKGVVFRLDNPADI